MVSKAVIFALCITSAHSIELHAAPSQLNLAIVDAPHLNLAVVVGADVKAIHEMEKSFIRSDDAHQKAMDAILKNLTSEGALKLLEDEKTASFNATDLKQIMSLATGTQNLRTATTHDGFGGLDGARKLLNDMLKESMTKYDAEIAKCTDFYAKQCALMEVARGQISAANFVAATSRALILDAQGNIVKCEVEIPKTKKELKDHDDQCKTQEKKLNAKLKLVMGDIAVMTTILEMTDCEKKSLVQTNKLSLIRCEDDCKKKASVSFNYNKLQKEVDQLDDKTSKELMGETFKDLFDDSDDLEEALEFVQVAGSDYSDIVRVNTTDAADMMPPKKKKPTGPAKKTAFKNAPVPRTEVPQNPCTDPNAGAPVTGKRAGKCTLKKSPQCFKLQGRFLQMQAEIADQRDALMQEISELQDACKETKKTLESAIENDNSLLSSSQTKLATATEKEANAGENGRQVAKENDAYKADLMKQMKTCSANYANLEQEQCALRKIRGDLYKKMAKPAGSHKGFFQDCEVSKWVPEACTKKCAGGEQKLVRNVLTHKNGGADCLPLSAKRRCNLSPCAVNCKQGEWSGWGKCSAKCGGGVQGRVRDVKQAMRYDGTPCESNSETKVCNVQSCEKDCVLKSWTKYTECSKDCDGGTMKRNRFVKEAAEGSGKCAGVWDPKRLQYKDCNNKACKVRDPKAAMPCLKKWDTILVMDGTPKSGAGGWAAEQKQAKLVVDAFKNSPNIAVVHYTGPRTWSGVSKCTGKSKKKVDMEKTCKVKIASHFDTDKKKVKGVIDGLKYEPGSKLLSLALMTVQSELALGRKSAPTVVIVFVDGQPLSFRKTLMTAQKLRKSVRLVFVPVTKFSPLKDLKLWTTRRWQENLVVVKDEKEMASPETGTHIIANLCPAPPVPKKTGKNGKKQKKR